MPTLGWFFFCAFDWSVCGEDGTPQPDGELLSFPLNLSGRWKDALITPPRMKSTPESKRELKIIGYFCLFCGFRKDPVSTNTQVLRKWLILNRGARDEINTVIWNNCTFNGLVPGLLYVQHPDPLMTGEYIHYCQQDDWRQELSNSIVTCLALYFGIALKSIDISSSSSVGKWSPSYHEKRLTGHFIFDLFEMSQGELTLTSRTECCHQYETLLMDVFKGKQKSLVEICVSVYVTVVLGVPGNATF